MSRPPRAEAPCKSYQVRLSPEELRRMDDAARVNHQRRSEFTRDAVMAAAEECLEQRSSCRVAAE